ncbi:PREDICTED: uncharacterized protein LOC106785245 isoform X2 [Polistes canadensis]|uniref:uncharacterized protein LOC106785245 isoform X2 n=1 Tax=Polistes canadensis TaxID=91411 RepID=UPI000718EBCC|nr:PREDICTED: uncharacterized protein LOC106785245 isoform X2 [Polistes canadensis]
MTSWINCFYVALCLIYFGTFTFAIYDPKETTTKAPNHRESFLPWYLNEKDLQPPDDLARSAKWWTNAEENEPRKPVIVNSDSKSWTPWRKTSGSEIELRTEITDDQISEQHHDHDQIDDHLDDHLDEHPPEGQYGYGSTSKDNNVYQDSNNPVISGSKLKHKLSEDSDSALLYEGIGSESTKPRQERILFWTNPISTVAHYDSQSGVQCPNLDSTGQFIYPPDCKFFVNCWKGRAFVQPCAPGTLFNPLTLECDFPYKVTCYGSEISEPIRYSKAYNLEIDEEREESHKPKCPPHVAGLIPHPTDCTKFLSCANGMTFEMDCGPGTVFNPALSVCDWPYHVKGCEDTFKSKEDTTKIIETPPDPSFHNHNVHYGSNNNFADRLEHNVQSAEKKIECPEDFTGLLPHPENCRKFLQCANGITYVMDCGPGTAFNPLISVCDWPYKVPACKEENKLKQVTTTSRPWLPYGRGDLESSHEHPRYNHTYNRYNNHGQGSRNNQVQPATTTELPRTVWRPTWRPMIQKPKNNLQNQSNSMGSNNNYGNYQNHNHHHDHGYHHDHEYHHDHGHYHDHGHHHNNHSGSGQPMSDVNCNITNHMTHSPNPYDSRDVYHHYHYHYHHYLPKINDTQYPGNRRISESNGHQQGSSTVHNTEETWNYANYPTINIDNFNRQQTNNQSGESIRRFGSYVPTGNRFNSTVQLHRMNNSRNNPEFVNRQINESISSNKNIYVNNDYDSHDEVESRDRTNRNLSVQFGTDFSRPNQNNITWSRPTVFENKSENSNQPSSRPWNQEEPPFPVYYIPPVQSLSHSKKVSPPTPISGQIIRLRDGPSSSDGYVEVQGAQPGWGIVCDSRNSWSLKEADVVCRQLGYSRGAEMAWQGRSKRNGMPTWIAANSVTCSGNEIRFQSCKFTHEQECRVERDAIGVRCLPNRIVHCRKDEIPHDGQCYHLADSENGLNHAEALQYCSKRNSRLIDIVSQAENDFISEWLSQSHPEIGSIMTSGVGFTTFNRTLWLWEDSSRSKFKFTKWWPGWTEDKKLPPWVGSRPACIIMKRKFPCHNRPDSICVADYFFWDIEDCATSMKGHAYICKRPYDDIGCIYGKGNQYFGTANVTESGKECLSWSDNRVLHYLNLAVTNRDVKKKLQPHNYCRNPNPNVETMPWCYTGPFGERDYCDLPLCGKIESKKMHFNGKCKPKHFECLPGECIPSPWVCDGEEDCTNGADERACIDHLHLYQKFAKHRLEGYDVEKWLNTPLKTCALRCKEADFTCRSFAHKASGNICLLSDSNIGLTGALKSIKDFDYYEMKERSIKCEDMFVCENRKCINHTLVCNGKNDCNDRTDENICTVENLDYAIRLAGSDNLDEGRVEVKILGVWGQVCDDGFGMINADVICKELGFPLGALEIKPGGYYGNLDPPTRFMVDQLKCRGNETSLRHCDFEGWGVHNCQPEEAVGVVCKTAVDTCQDGHWKCENSPECIPIAFICDVVPDCSDKSDESDERCNAPFDIRLVNGTSPLEGRVEIYHHGIWGTVCDDDFSAATARVICRSLGYNGVAKPKKNGFFGPGQGPIWLDEVFCHGNETQLYRCNHDQWGRNNCDHNEDAGVICSYGNANDDSEYIWDTMTDLPETRINDVLPANCGKRSEDFNDDEDLIFAKVVHGSIAPKGTYPWQASIRVRGHSRSNHWCGAVVLSPLHVLTAAHCLEGYNKGTYFVRAGDYNTEEQEGTEREANIEDYYIHEDFRKGHRMNNDIALILLKGQGIPLGKDIMPICLPPENTEYPAGFNCTISGFGSIETGRTTPSRNLRYGWIPLLDQSVCRAEHVYGPGKISDGMVCAGHLNEGVDTCDGDSGGPLACYHNGAFTLYGITSWGQHCGKANKPGVYVRVAHYRRWIDQKIMDSLSGR